MFIVAIFTINLRTAEPLLYVDHCKKLTEGHNKPNALPTGALAVYPISGNMWLVDLIERVTGRIITRNLTNFEDKSKYDSIFKQAT